MNNINKKSILIAIVIFMIGLLITGGTYAYLTVAMTVTNGNYVTNTHCFGVTYQNDDTSITGTLFPSGDAIGGITDWVSATADATCGLTGKGTLKIHVNSASNVLTGTVAAHCENENTLETQEGYTTQSTCTAVAGNKWVTDGTALKYAVFSGDDLYSSGYIKSTDIGNDIIVHDNFSVTTTLKKYFVHIWLDGYLSNENYHDLDFSASSNMIVSQAKSTETYPGDTPLVDGYLIQLLNKLDPSDERLYQRVEYIQSTGTQYIDTGYVPKTNTTLDLTLSFSGTFTTGGVSTIFEARDNDNDYALNFGGAAGQYNTLYMWHDKTYSSGASVYNFVITDAIRTNKNTISVGTNKITYGSVSKTIPVKTADNTTSMKLFGSYGGKPIACYNMRVYELKIYESGALVRHYIPSYRKSDNVAGLYDMVNNVFYTNAATSGNDFTIGPEV